MGHRLMWNVSATRLRTNHGSAVVYGTSVPRLS